VSVAEGGDNFLGILILLQDKGKPLVFGLREIVAESYSKLALGHCFVVSLEELRKIMMNLRLNGC
jgi:hypothetical protein